METQKRFGGLHLHAVLWLEGMPYYCWTRWYFARFIDFHHTTTCQLPVVTLSTCASEYVSAAETAKHIVHFRELLEQIGFPQREPTVLRNDNESSNHAASIHSVSSKMQHVRVRFHFIKELVANNEVKMEYCKSKDLSADLLTKPLARPQTEVHRKTILGY